MNPADDFMFTKGKYEELTRYKFNTGSIMHVFCPVCGCGIFAQGREAVCINLRAVADVDLDRLTLKKYDGRAR